MKRDIIPWRRKRNDTKLARFNGEESNPFLALHREMNQLFDDFFGGLETNIARPRNEALRRDIDAWSFNVDVAENEHEVRVVADLPGMEEKDIQVELTNDRLTIKGEKNTERDEQKEDYHLMERSYGSFYRTVPLPAGLEDQQAKARFKNGVLTITIPKSPDAKRPKKQIQITQG